jgi:GTPase SAR1 family protein
MLGPTGAGKSSCIYTLWRAINGIAGDQEIRAQVDQLRMGWTISDDSDAKAVSNQPQAMHGTQTVSSFVLREATANHGGILIQGKPLFFPPYSDSPLALSDTMGQQFYDEKETKYISALVAGTLRDGSTLEQMNLRYWLTIGSLHFLPQTTLETSPHVLLLVFDASLSSLNKLLNIDFTKDMEWENRVPQLACYHQVLDQAKESELEVFICLTHIDLYEKQRKRKREEETHKNEFPGEENAKDEDEEGHSDKRIGEDVQDELEYLIEKLSEWLSLLILLLLSSQ